MANKCYTKAGARMEKREHPWATMKQARQINCDHRMKRGHHKGKSSGKHR